MFAKLCVLFLAIGLSQAGPSRIRPEASFMEYMMKSRDLIQATASSDCFATYVPKLQAVIEQWEADTKLCESNAEAARLEIDDNNKENRTEIDNSANNACDALSTCSKETSSLDYYSCYSQSAADDTKIMYTISANSAELLAIVKEDYRLIQNEEYVCSNKSERAYVENSAAVYEELDNCLNGRAVTQASTTPSPSTSDDSSSVSTESSAAPSEDTSSASTESSAAPSEDTSSASTESSAAPSEDTSPASTESSAAPSEDTSSASTESSAAPSEDTSSASTESSSAPTDSDKENLPEEDLSRLAAEQTKLKSMMEDFKQWFNRH